MDDHVRLGQVQACSARLQRNEEHGDVPLLEFFHHFPALLFVVFARQVQIFSVPLLNEQFQHGGELGKNQHPMARAHCVLQKLHAGVHLAGTALVILVAKGGGAAKLAQTGQRGQNLDAVALHFLRVAVGQIVDQLIPAGLVQLGLLAVQLDVHVFFQLVRQVFQHVSFFPPQQEGGHHPTQAVLDDFVLLLGNGLLDFPAEGGVGVQIARHDAVENAPQIAEPVFHRRSGHGEAVGRLQALNALGRFGGGVLDVLSLVQHQAGEGQALVVFHVPLEQVVRSNVDLVVFAVCDQFPAFQGVPGDDLY